MKQYYQFNDLTQTYIIYTNKLIKLNAKSFQLKIRFPLIFFENKILRTWSLFATKGPINSDNQCFEFLC